MHDPDGAETIDVNVHSSLGVDLRVYQLRCFSALSLGRSDPRGEWKHKVVFMSESLRTNTLPKNFIVVCQFVYLNGW